MNCAICGRVEDYIRHDVGFFGSHPFVPQPMGYVMDTPRWEDLITGADALWAHEIRVRLD